MKKKIAIIGGGTSCLFLASFLDEDKYDITIYEKKSSLGRKFLVAGDGGFNLTYAEGLPIFKTRYSPTNFLDTALDYFSNDHLIEWLIQLGISTFVGSSGRVFPIKGIKPIDVLKSIKSHLIIKGVQFEFNKTFTGWKDNKALIFNTDEIIDYDIAVFALGGASWKVTGSDGSWFNLFKKKKISTVPFRASNCAFKVNWDKAFILNHEGQPLKNIAITINNKTQKGEVVITQFGIEGNGIYGLSPEIQDSIEKQKVAKVFIDFKPSLDLETVINKLTQSNSNISTSLKEKLKLTRPIIDLIKETLSKEEYLDIKILAQFIKAFPLRLIDSATINEAISTSGGVSLDAIDEHYQLKGLKNNFCVGEMLDWDAPTGGYLIQACASMGAHLAHYLNHICPK